MSTPTNAYGAVLATSSTASSFTSKVATSTEPTGDGVLDVGEHGLNADFLMVQPFGTDADGEAFNMRIWGWFYDATNRQWQPNLLSQCTVTLGNIAASKGTNSLDADTITQTHGSSNTSVVSTGNDTSAYLVLDMLGAEKVEFDFDMTTAASGNALARKITNQFSK